MDDWRSQVSMSDRFDHIQNLQFAGASKAEAQKAAYAAETNFFNDSQTLEEYQRACGPPAADVISEPARVETTQIGDFVNCHHISSGLVSEVYRSDTVALKVITETQGVEPHNAAREVRVLRQLSHPAIIKLLRTAKDDDGRLILVFPYLPYTLANLLSSKDYQITAARPALRDLFSALACLHASGIIHRDLKPSNILLESLHGPAKLADFGTVWLPDTSEPADHKVLEVGTTCYRAPETLFGNRAYGTSLDMWAAGAIVAECSRLPPAPLFTSPPTSEDGNQLALILSIFKTLGTPTEDTWPEAKRFPTPPFQWYNEFPAQSFAALLPEASSAAIDLVRSLVRFESSQRLTAEEALSHSFF